VGARPRGLNRGIKKGRLCRLGDDVDHCRGGAGFGIVGFVTAPPQASLVEQLAATLPPGTSAAQTRRLVRNAVRRARRERLPLTQEVLVELLIEECGGQQNGNGRRH